MDSLQFRLAEIRVNEDRPNDRLVEYLHFDHDRKQGKPFHLFAVAEIHSSLYLYERLLDALHTAMSQAKTFVSGMDGDPMVRFEKVIQRLNEALTRVASEESEPIEWSRVNLFVFQLADAHLCFSGVGSLTNLFLQRQPSGQTKAFDLLGSLEQPETFDERKPLASLVCGNLGVGDMLLLGTQNLHRYREAIQLTALLEAHPPVAAATEIQQRISQLQTDEQVFGLVIAGVAITPPKPPVVVASPTQELIVDEPDEALPSAVQSVQDFYAAEQETDTLLSDHAVSSSNAPSFLKRLHSLARPLRAKIQNYQPASKKDSSFSSPVSLSGLRSMHAGYAKTLVEKHRAIAIGGVLAVVLLGGGGMWIRSARTKQAEQKLWSAVYDQAVIAKDQAEAALVYGDEDRARAQYTKAASALTQLDQATDDRAQTRATLEQDLNEIRARLRREEVVQNPTVLANFRAEQPNTTANSLTMHNGQLYSIDTASGDVLIYNLETQALSRIASPQNTSLRLLGNGQNGPILVGDAQAFFTIRNNAIVPMTVAASKASSTTAVTSYGQRVYTLDSTGNTIWRWNASGVTLNAPANYLKTPLDLSKAVALAIDASVYIGINDGRLIKLLSGQVEPWNAATIDPPLTSISHLWTSAEATSLVVSDPANKRVVLFNKDGSLAKQISSPAFESPSAAWVDTAKNQLFILDAGRVLRVDLSSS